MLQRFVVKAMFMLSLLVFVVSLMLLGTLSVNAQGLPHDADGRRPPRTEELIGALRLSSQKTTEVRNILDAERQAMRSLDDSIRTQREAIHRATRAKLAATLTPDQLQRYEAWRETNRPVHKERLP